MPRSAFSDQVNQAKVEASEKRLSAEQEKEHGTNNESKDPYWFQTSETN
jgi:hypothetical protein